MVKGHCLDTGQAGLPSALLSLCWLVSRSPSSSSEPQCPALLRALCQSFATCPGRSPELLPWFQSKPHSGASPVPSLVLKINKACSQGGTD